MADEYADCPMAHMIDIDTIEKVRSENPDVCVVCYVNSTAEIKAHSDVCVTSSNAIRIVKALPNRKIFFIPDNNLGRYVAAQVPEKEFIFHDGFCHVHKSIEKENVLAAKAAHPEALVLTHPECTQDVLEISDFIGSTSEIIDYATGSDKKTFIICTEMGIFYELGQKNPDKKFYSVGHRQFCPNMKRITLEKVLTALQTLSPEVILNEDLSAKANQPLSRMLELAK
jgi:quinolinate synthase